MDDTKSEFIKKESMRLVDEANFDPIELMVFVRLTLKIAKLFQGLPQASQTKILKLLYDYQCMREGTLK